MDTINENTGAKMQSTVSAVCVCVGMIGMIVGSLLEPQYVEIIVCVLAIMGYCVVMCSVLMPSDVNEPPMLVVSAVCVCVGMIGMIGGLLSEPQDVKIIVGTVAIMGYCVGMCSVMASDVNEPPMLGATVSAVCVGMIGMIVGSLLEPQDVKIIVGTVAIATTGWGRKKLYHAQTGRSEVASK